MTGKHFHDKGRILDTFVVTNNFYDVLNENDPKFLPNRSFGLYSKLFCNFMDKTYYRTLGKWYKSKFSREDLPYRLVNDISKKFLELMLNSLVYENTRWEFPRKQMSIYIRHRKLSSKKYKYNILTEGRDYIPYIRIKFLKLYAVLPYVIKFNCKWEKKIEEQVKKGFEYGYGN